MEMVVSVCQNMFWRRKKERQKTGLPGTLEFFLQKVVGLAYCCPLTAQKLVYEYIPKYDTSRTCMLNNGTQFNTDHQKQFLRQFGQKNRYQSAIYIDIKIIIAI